MTTKHQAELTAIAEKIYDSYLGFDPESGTAVVILSNLSPNDRIPATVLGVNLLKELRQ